MSVSTSLGPDSEPTTADLVNTAIDQVRTLVREELALARAELRIKAKRAVLGGGLLGAAALLGHDSLLVAWTLVIVCLNIIWPLWAAVLVTLAGLLLLAATCAALGRLSLRRTGTPTPGAAAESVATDLQAVKKAVQEGRSR
jgi:hypothetical protein